MTQNKHSNACLVLLQAQNNFGAVHIVLDRLKKIFNLDMVQNVEFGSEIMFDLVQIENLFWTYTRRTGHNINLKKIFTSAHPIHYSPNRNILSKNYDAFFSH